MHYEKNTKNEDVDLICIMQYVAYKTYMDGAACSHLDVFTTFVVKRQNYTFFAYFKLNLINCYILTNALDSR